MSKIISKICKAGHPCRATEIRALCECSAPLFAKDSPEGKAIVAAMKSGKKKHHSAGYGGRDNKAGKRQAYRAYGDSETAARIE